MCRDGRVAAGASSAFGGPGALCGWGRGFGVSRWAAGCAEIETPASVSLQSSRRAAQPCTSDRIGCPPSTSRINRGGSGSPAQAGRSEEHTSELQSLMRISYAVFCLKKKKKHNQRQNTPLVMTQTPETANK